MAWSEPRGGVIFSCLEEERNGGIGGVGGGGGGKEGEREGGRLRF